MKPNTRLPLIALVVLLASASVRADLMDDLVAADMAKRHIPGVSLAVVQGRKIVKIGAYGKANVELDVAVKPTTVFQIQSMTKTFTSTAILLLAEEGKLKLDDPVSQHLAGTPDSWKAITIRHLLSHTSGIKDFINEPTADIRLDVSEQDVFDAAVKRPLNFQPGDEYRYSNTNYHLLAMVIRKLTGKHYGEFLKERIFTPLRMSDTRVVALRELIPNRAAGYSWDGKALRNGGYVAESILGYGGGGVVSTSAVLAKWAVALQAGGVLKEESWKQAWTGFALNGGKTSGYGLGWGVGKLNGHVLVGHSGAHLTGFTSAIDHFPDDGLTVIVLTNSRNANPTELAHQIAGTYVEALKKK
jgi:CubicO group peptidase (beta-lactamase class C family)